MQFYIRNRLLETLYHSYTENFKEYGNFLVKLSYKEVKKNSSYKFEKRTIIINNLSNRGSDIFISGLASLAEHIDISIRKETHYDREYFLVLRKLINTAVKRNIINLDQVSKYNDKKIIAKLQEQFSSFKNWIIKIEDIIPEYTYVYVDDSFMIKNILLTNKYIYDRNQGLWYKKLATSIASKEQDFVSQYQNQATFTVVSDNSFCIRPMYMMKIKTYSTGDAPLLKAFEYLYNKHSNVWSKLVNASNIKQEQENVKDIPMQSLSFGENQARKN